MKIVVMCKETRAGRSAVIAEYDSLEQFQTRQFEFASDVFVVLITDSRQILMPGRWVTVATLAGKPIEYRLEFSEVDNQGYPITSGWTIRSTVIPV